jgi:hypothetical protein
MTITEWNEMYSDSFMFSLTNEERRYFALDPIAQQAESLTFVRDEGMLHTRVTVFFDGDFIVKVINETIGGNGNLIWQRCYEEYDTKLLTDHRQMLLPLTSRGKPKKLTASNINAVTPFGCRLYVDIRTNSLHSFSEVNLLNLRASKRFPLGEHELISNIRTEEDFRSFVNHYIATCQEGYFDKLQAFKDAPRTTVKYKPGDVFRIDYDRTQYCYGIITGTLKQLRSMADLPKSHTFFHLMTVPIMVRLYHLITDDHNLTVEKLADIPLDEVTICSDNDIIWGTHPIIGHKNLTPDDLYFKLYCTLKTHYTGRFTLEGCSMNVEWGFSYTTLTYDQMSDKLKSQLDCFPFSCNGVCTWIDPDFISSGDSAHNFLHLKNSELRAEVFSCLGLPVDTSFDQFAKKFGGLTLQEIVSKMK